MTNISWYRSPVACATSQDPGNKNLGHLVGAAKGVLDLVVIVFQELPRSLVEKNTLSPFGSGYAVDRRGWSLFWGYQLCMDFKQSCRNVDKPKRTGVLRSLPVKLRSDSVQTSKPTPSRSDCSECGVPWGISHLLQTRMALLPRCSSWRDPDIT